MLWTHVCMVHWQIKWLWVWVLFIHLFFSYHGCFEQGVPWYSGSLRVYTHSKRLCDMIKRHDLQNALAFSDEMLTLFLKNTLTPQVWNNTSANAQISISALLLVIFWPGLTKKKLVCSNFLTWCEVVSCIEVTCWP